MRKKTANPFLQLRSYQAIHLKDDLEYLYGKRLESYFLEVEERERFTERMIFYTSLSLDIYKPGLIAI